MEKSKLSQLVTEILSYAKERYGSIATPDAATVVCAAATLLSSDGSYNTTDEDDQKKLVRKLVELSSDNVEPTLKKAFVYNETCDGEFGMYVAPSQVIMEKSKLSQLVTEILSYAKERYGSIATPDAATVVCAAATLLSSDGSYNTTDEDDQKKLVRKLVELSSDNVEPTLKKDQDDPDSVEATLVTRYTTKGVINQLNAAWSDLKQAIDHVYDIESGILNNMPFDVFPSLLFGDRMKQYALNVINCLWETPEVKEAQHKATEIYAKEEASDLLEWRLNKYKETVKKWADFTASKFEKRYKDETQFLKLWNILHTTKCSTFVQNVDPVFKPKDMPVKNLETGEIVTPEEALRSIGDHLPPIPTKEEFEKNLPAYKDVKPFHEVLHDLKPGNTKREKLTKAEQIEFKIWQLKELKRKYSDMWEATINDPDGVEESEPFLDKQEEIGEQIVKLEQKLKELKKNQN